MLSEKQGTRYQAEMVILTTTSWLATSSKSLLLVVVVAVVVVAAASCGGGDGHLYVAVVQSRHAVVAVFMFHLVRIS